MTMQLQTISVVDANNHFLLVKHFFIVKHICHLTYTLDYCISYTQEMASSLAQKHLRSIILNVSINFESVKLSDSCETQGVSSPPRWCLKLLNTVKLYNLKYYCSALLETIAFSILWSLGVESFIPETTSSASEGRLGELLDRTTKCDMAWSPWSGTKSALKMIPFGTDSSGSAWLNWLQMSVRKMLHSCLLEQRNILELIQHYVLWCNQTSESGSCSTKSRFLFDAQTAHFISVMTSYRGDITNLCLSVCLKLSGDCPNMNDSWLVCVI